MLFLRKLLMISNYTRCKSTWIEPAGYDTGIQIYNCITKTKVPLIIENKTCMTMYTCGPTVYDSAHAGHASCYVKLDIIQRILRNYFNFNLVTVMNITDIDDKIINKSKILNKSPIEVARYHEKEFLQDLDSLMVNRPDVLVRVTDNMGLIVKFIKKLLDDKYAYKTADGSVYFDVSQYKNYGKLQKIGTSSEEVSTFKKSPMDFVLWKAAKQNEPYWDSTFGPGRPGWHIECSALAGNIIGPAIDLHAGGIDLRFPHHENEEALSCTYFSKPQWVNYWMHIGHLHLKDSVKMSKSLKNTISIQEMLKTTNVQVFRIACLMSHYRSSMEYSENLISAAQHIYNNMINFMDDCNSFLKGQLVSDINDMKLLINLHCTMAEVTQQLIDDFNTPGMIKCLLSLMSRTNKMLHSVPSNNPNYLNKINDPMFPKSSVSIKATLNYILKTFKTVGVDFRVKQTEISQSEDYSDDVTDVLLKFRQNVQQLGISEGNRNMQRLCDDVREELKAVGIYVKDHGKLSSWSK